MNMAKVVLENNSSHLRTNYWKGHRQSKILGNFHIISHFFHCNLIDFFILFLSYHCLVDKGVDQNQIERLHNFGKGKMLWNNSD
jgi:hypothetical protein